MSVCLSLCLSTVCLACCLRVYLLFLIACLSTCLCACQPSSCSTNGLSPCLLTCLLACQRIHMFILISRSQLPTHQTLHLQTVILSYHSSAWACTDMHTTHEHVFSSTVREKFQLYRHWIIFRTWSVFLDVYLWLSSNKCFQDVNCQLN